MDLLNCALKRSNLRTRTILRGLGEVWPLSMLVVTYEFLPGWKVVFKKLGDLFETWKDMTRYNFSQEIRIEIERDCGKHGND
jgi:hypothetical protein